MSERRTDGSDAVSKVDVTTSTFRDVVTRRLGLQFDDSKLGFLAEVLERRVLASGSSVDDYLRELSRPSGGRSELKELAKELTVSETYFFRHMAQFRAFQKTIDERLSANPGGRRVRVLSAGCASGEEAYSLAMLLREQSLDGATFQSEVYACDVNPDALARASAGRFSRWSLRETSDEHRRRWFTRDGTDYLLDPVIRDSVTFTSHNLVEDAFGPFVAGTFDVIFCRNVLMYFEPETARRVVHTMGQLLARGGYLFLGHAENLRGLSHDFHLCHLQETFYYQRRGAFEASTWTPLASESSGGTPVASRSDGGESSWVNIVQRASERVRQLTSVVNRDEQGAGDDPGVAEVAATGDTRATSTRPGLDATMRLVAEERFSEALALLSSAPNTDAEALLLRAVLLAQNGAWEEAEKAVEAVLAVDESNAGAHYVSALCAEGSGAQARAIEHYRVASDLDPTFAMSRLHLGILARRAGDSETAQSELRAASELLLREDSSRLLLFGGGFRREGLVALCQAELRRLGGEQ